jgi:hypothetical protein
MRRTRSSWILIAALIVGGVARPVQAQQITDARAFAS